jgi:hypothetical protein
MELLFFAAFPCGGAAHLFLSEAAVPMLQTDATTMIQIVAPGNRAQLSSQSPVLGMTGVSSRSRIL